MAADNLINDAQNAHLSPAVRARLQKCYEFGNQKMQAGEYDYANEMFGQCFVGSPGNLIYLQSFIANLRLKYGNNKKGASSFLKMRGGGARTALKVAETRSKWEDVLKAGADLLKLNPWDSAVFFSMGKAALAIGYDDTGLALLKHAIESNPTDIEVNRFAAEELYKRNLYDDAIACCQRILKLKDNDAEANRLLKDLLLQKTMKHMENKKEMAAKTAEEANEKNVSEEDVFEKKLDKTPKDRDLWIEYANFFANRNNRRKEEDVLRRAVKHFPDDISLTMRLADIHKVRAKEEVGRLQELYKKNPSDAVKKQLLNAKKAFDEATLDLIKRRLAQNPNATNIRFEYGMFLIGHGHFREAISEFQKAQQDNSLRSEAFLAIAQCFEQIKQYKLAMDQYNKAIESFGEAVTEPAKRALYYGARLAAAMGDLKHAENLAGKLASIDFSYKDVGDLLDKIAKKMQN